MDVVDGHVVGSGVDQSRDEELVVDARGLDLVKQVLLHEFGVHSVEGPTNGDLDLTLLKVPGLQAQMASLRENAELLAAAACERRCQEAARGATRNAARDDVKDLDLLLFALRRHFRKEHDRWQGPLMGKNRLLSPVEGYPYVKGGFGDIEAVTKPRGNPALMRLATSGGGWPRGPRVGILDTAVFAHVDLAGRYVGDSFTTPPDPAVSTAAHATFIAGLILQRAPNAELVVSRGLGDDGTNQSSWDVATRLADFLHAGVAVVNMSFGCVTADGQCPFVLKRAVERLAPSVVLVAAAGNHGDRGDDEGDRQAGLTGKTPMWPAAHDDVVAVGARIDDDGPDAPFSPRAAWVDLRAPGVDVTSTFLPGDVHIVHREHPIHQGETMVNEGAKHFGEHGYAVWSGTSFAAANVTGEIADRAEPGRLSPWDALDQLLHPEPTDPPSRGIEPFVLSERTP